MAVSDCAIEFKLATELLLGLARASDDVRLAALEAITADDEAAAATDEARLGKLAPEATALDAVVTAWLTASR